MNLHLPRYREVKDRYCVCYFGPCDEYITLLCGLRKIIEANLPGLQLYVGCRDHLYGSENTVPESAVIKMIREPWGTAFGHIREIRCDLSNHPVEKFLSESGLLLGPASPYEPQMGNRVLSLNPNGVSPTRSLTETQTAKVIAKYKEEGWEVRINYPWQEAGLVVGVENTPLWSAAIAGKPVTLCETGLGTALFRVIASWGEVISV
jgi:hypothetical protein